MVGKVMIENLIIILLISSIVCAILFYLYKSKKQGNNCIGCPNGRQCSKKHANQNADK